MVDPNRAHRQPPDISADTTAHFLCPTTGKDMMPTVAGREGRKRPTLARKISYCALLAKMPIAKLTKRKLASINCENESAGQQACFVQGQVCCPRGDAS